MKIFVSQIYIKPEVVFFFSLRFQKWIGDVLTDRVEASEQFCKTYGANYALGLRISAKEGNDKPEIKGPTVFKRAKNVEFTIFLPHKAKRCHESKNSLVLMQQFLQATVRVLEQLGLDAAKVLADSKVLETEFLTVPGLLDAAKNSASPAEK